MSDPNPITSDSLFKAGPHRSYFDMLQPTVYEYRIIGINTAGVPGPEQQHQLDKAAAEGFTFLYGRDNYILLARTVAAS